MNLELERKRRLGGKEDAYSGGRGDFSAKRMVQFSVVTATCPCDGRKLLVHH